MGRSRVRIPAPSGRTGGRGLGSGAHEDSQHGSSDWGLGAVALQAGFPAWSRPRPGLEVSVAVARPARGGAAEAVRRANVYGRNRISRSGCRTLVGTLDAVATVAWPRTPAAFVGASVLLGNGGEGGVRSASYTGARMASSGPPRRCRCRRRASARTVDARPRRQRAAGATPAIRTGTGPAERAPQSFGSADGSSRRLRCCRLPGAWTALSDAIGSAGVVLLNCWADAARWPSTSPPHARRLFTGSLPQPLTRADACGVGRRY
jgi:hypothetical protein